MERNNMEACGHLYRQGALRVIPAGIIQPLGCAHSVRRSAWPAGAASGGIHFRQRMQGIDRRI